MNRNAKSSGKLVQDRQVTSVPLPSESDIASTYATTHLADAYRIELASDATSDPEVLARFIVAQQAPWVGKLMKVRDALVAGFGLKTSKHLESLGAQQASSRVGIFKIYSKTSHEITLGEDDTHLDFRLSLLCSGQATAQGKRYVTLSTVVHCHNLLGRTYIFIIAPFHRIIVQAGLRRAARIGWPKAS